MIAADLNAEATRIEVRFPYDPAAVASIKSVPGARFLPREKGGPAWTLPLDLTTGRLLREAFGSALVLGPELLRWGRLAVAKERNLGELTRADFVELQRVPQARPELHRWLLNRPFQTADVAMMAATNVINANQPGMGKTTELVAAVVEAGLEQGQHLVIAPATSLTLVWKRTILRLLPDATVLTGDTVPEREAAIAEAARLAAAGEPFWLVLNPALVRLQAVYEIDDWGKKREAGTSQKYPELGRIAWDTVTVDEYHKMGLANTKTLGARGVHALKARRRFALSGTPMGGKPIRLWGALHFLEPVQYSSKWRWAQQWLVIEEKKGRNGQVFGKEIGGIQPGKEEAFYAALAPHMIRRLNTSAPEAQEVIVPCGMTKRQAKQYKRVEDASELVAGKKVTDVDGTLAEYLRLKQIAGAYCEIRPDGTVHQTKESGKIEQLAARLAERGIDPDPDDAAGEEKALVFTQFSRFAVVVAEELRARGFQVALLTAAVKGADRAAIVDAFQAEGGPRVLVLTTQLGGVSLTLERAETVHLLDETWDPDDQEQAIGRVVGRGRNHQVTVYRYITDGTIEEYVNEITGGKAAVNAEVLDALRERYRAAGEVTKTRK